MKFIEINPTVIEAFAYKIDEEPDWFIAARPKILTVRGNREYFTTQWGDTRLCKGDYVYMVASNKDPAIRIAAREVFLASYKPTEPQI